MRQLLLTLSCFCCFVVVAQDFYPPVVNYGTKDYGKNRNPESYCVVQDERGVMYFGTANGVLEFDGEKWKFIKTATGAFVRALAIDNNGVIYCGSYGNFGKLKTNDIGGLVYESFSAQLPEEDQFFSDVWNIYVLHNQVYFQTEEAIFEYDTETENTKVIYAENSFHTCFLVDDTLYVREREKGILRYVGDGKFDVLAGTSIFETYGLFGLHKLNNDSLLVVTQELGLFKWGNGELVPLQVNDEEKLDQLGIIGSLALKNGDFVLNTLSSGIIVIDSNGKVKRKIDRFTGIRSDAVFNVYQDRDLNLWLAMDNGISKVNYHSPLSYFDEKAGIEGNVDAIIRFKGNLYVGTTSGLFVSDNSLQSLRKFKNVPQITKNVWSFCTVEDVLYVCTGGGVFMTKDGDVFNQMTAEQVNVLSYNQAHKHFISAGPQGIKVYGNTFNDVWSYDGNFTNFIGIQTDPKIPTTTWIGSVKSGVLKLYVNDFGDFEINQYGDADGLIDDLGKPILLGNELVFGTKEGLYSFTNEEQMKEELRDELTEEQLANPAFYKGVFNPTPLYDSLFKKQVIHVVKGEEFTWYCADIKIGAYNHEKKTFKNRPFWGIDYGRINTFYLEENDVLWIGASDGLIRYKKNNYKEYESVFYAAITQFNVETEGIVFNGMYVDEKGQFLIDQPEDEIPAIIYKNNTVEFTFSAPYFEDEHRPIYRYQLVGEDKEWSDWDLKSEVSYNNLEEGSYEFKVEAKNIYGQLSKIATYKFTILPPWYRTTWAYFLYAIGFIMILLLGVMISSRRLKAKNLWLEGVVEERTREISDKNIVLEHQKKEIEDSINYAQRIQEAILPLEDEMKKWIPKSFVLFRPKDIVSGDFYWFLERDRKLVFICADCTGHGVPGAFMSMIGSDRLNNIVSENKITSPGAILSELNQAIKKSLKQDGQKNSTRDGMDASICTVDLDKNCVYYSGAYRPLWIIENDELKEIKATKVAVAGFTADDQVYEEHCIELKPGMKMYMTTDGYADQFGGDQDKKYKVKRMKRFICEHSTLPFAEQRNLLEQELLSWMGDREQVDDVCVVGFEIA